MILLLLGILHLVGGALIADSQSDFSGTQGYKGWRYRYDGGDYFAEFPTYSASWVGGTNSWQNVDSWCQIGASTMHTTTGGGDTMCSSPVGYCAPILTWGNPNPIENRSITLTASHASSISLPTRDGVILNLKINDDLIDSFTTPFTINKNYGPLNISTIELILDPKNTCNNDGTSYRLQIYGPDPTPTPSATVTSTKTSTRSPSPSATGICNDIFNNLYGTQEIADGGGVFFTVNHGANVTHFEPFALCGQFPTCVDNGASCVCTYTSGDSFSCNVQRRTIITYTYGANRISYGGQSPSCTYYISRAFSFASPTPSPTLTSSITSSSSITPSPSATGICNEIKNYVNGRLEPVYDTNGTLYNLFHGRYITTPYQTNFDMLLGVFDGCVENGNSCLCNYRRGYNVECPDGIDRSAIVNFTYGSALQTSYFNQSSCSFVFNASYIRPSKTPSPTYTPTKTASWTPSSSNTASWTASATPTSTYTSTQTPSFTGTPTQSATSSSSATASFSATQTASATATQTASHTRTITPTVTPTGICNDVRNYVFGRTDFPTAEYTIYHGDRMTHYYYPGTFVLIGAQPHCIDRGNECVCTYDNGDSDLCSDSRRGIIRYSYDDVYATKLVNDSDPVCVYKFNTTFFLPYLSPTPTRTLSATPTPTQTATPTAAPTFVPRFIAGAVSILPIPPNFPTIPTNASADVLADLASNFIGTLNTSSESDDLVNALAVLASSLAAVSGNLSLSINGTGFTWVMTSAASNAPVFAGNVSAVLPALDANMVYSFLATETNSSFPTFSVDALGTANDRFTITGLSTPLEFTVSAAPQTGQTVECVYWNGTDWASDGCAFVNGSCACTHFTEFSARFKSIADTNKNMFDNARAVYSLDGFKKYISIYGMLIGLFLGIAGIFLCLIYLDFHGEQRYRFAVEDVEEVCKVLGYDKPNVPQPTIALPTVNTRSVCIRFLNAWGSRILYQHSYVGIFFRYDPRLPRGFRLLLVTTVAFHTLFLTVLLYGYSKVDAQMTILESVVLSLITSALNIPFIRFLFSLMNKAGVFEYTARFPDLAHEYNRRRAFETALRSAPTSEILRVVDRLNNGKTPARAIQTSPGGARRNKNDNSELEDVSQMGDDTTDTMIMMVFDRIMSRCFPRRKRPEGGLTVALEIAKTDDPHFEIPRCNILPTKTVYGFLLTCACFGYIGWIMNYLLLFTASESTGAMNSIATSFGISQASSILMTQPLTLFLTIFSAWIMYKCRRRRGTNHIGYFADPAVKKSSSSLSGSWAYWIFLYGGSASSLGLSSNNRPLGYSSTQVASAWINGVHEVSVSPRDAALTTLYVYLRGIQQPLTARAAAVAAAGAELKQLLCEAPQSVIVKSTVVDEEETADLVKITNEIATQNKDA